eukprot:143800-Alexandrium_andersonii.AAC.1
MLLFHSCGFGTQWCNIQVRCSAHFLRRSSSLCAPRFSQSVKQHTSERAGKFGEWRTSGRGEVEAP